jgi:hypothetical protein
MTGISGCTIFPPPVVSLSPSPSPPVPIPTYLEAGSVIYNSANVRGLHAGQPFYIEGRLTAKNTGTGLGGEIIRCYGYNTLIATTTTQNDGTAYEQGTFSISFPQGLPAADYVFLVTYDGNNLKGYEPSTFTLTLSVGR